MGTAARVNCPMAVLAEFDEIFDGLSSTPLVCRVVNLEPARTATGLADIPCPPESAAATLRPLWRLQVLLIGHRAQSFLALVPRAIDVLIFQLVPRENGRAA